MKFFSMVSAGLIFSGFALRIAAAETTPSDPSVHTVLVGGREIKLPNPSGFTRVDGRDSVKDRFFAASLPPSNRLLARYESSDATKPSNQPTDQRSFNAQVITASENQEIGETTFADSKEQTKAELERLKASLATIVEKAVAGSNNQLSKETDGKGVLDVTDTAVLGIFDDSRSSLGFTMAMNVKVAVGDRSSTSKIVTSCMMVPVNGRLILLYSINDFNTDENRAWAEKSVSLWRDAVVAANPRVEGPSGNRSIFKNSGRSALIGAVVGGVFGLLSWFFRKKRKAAEMI